MDASWSETTAVGAWLRLLRVPNLFTVPGDSLAGFLLACAAGASGDVRSAVLAAGASLCLYMVGLITNDWFDLATDRRERPHRPLAAGRIWIPAALTVAGILAVLGVVLGLLAGHWAGLLAVTLLLFLLSYNAGGKRVPVWGPLNMGVCRGLSLMMGAAAAGASGPVAGTVVVSAIGLTLYVAGITFIAAGETKTGPVSLVRWAPPVVLVLWFGVLYLTSTTVSPTTQVVSMVLAFFAVVWAVYCAQSLAGTPEPVRVSRTIGSYLRGLLLVQAALVTMVLHPGGFVGVVLLLFFPISTRLARRFYAS